MHTCYGSWNYKDCLDVNRFDWSLAMLLYFHGGDAIGAVVVFIIFVTVFIISCGIALLFIVKKLEQAYERKSKEKNKS